MKKYNLFSNKRFSLIYYFLLIVGTGIFISHEKKQKQQHEKTIHDFLNNIKEYQIYDGIEDDFIMQSYIKRPNNMMIEMIYYCSPNQHQIKSRALSTKEKLLLGEKLYYSYLNPVAEPVKSEYMSYAKIIFNNDLEMYIEEINI